MRNGGYTFVQFVPRLYGDRQEVLLRKDDGSLFVCTKDEWNTLNNKEEMTPEQKFDLLTP